MMSRHAKKTLDLGPMQRIVVAHKRINGTKDVFLKNRYGQIICNRFIKRPR
jgi:hypothetical protein